MSKLIGIDITNELGQGAYKKAYKAIELTNEKENESLFVANLDIDSLAVVSITLKSNELKASIIEEFKLQYEYANNDPPLAPNLYLVTIQYGTEFIKNIPIDDFLDNGEETFNALIKKNLTSNTKLKPILYFLEELCGPTPGKKQPPLIIDDNFFIKVDQLIDNLINKSNLLFTDFKPQNTCPQYDASGNLSNIMALDLDLKFTYSLTDIVDDLNQTAYQETAIITNISQQIVLDFAKDYMFIQFYFVLLKHATNLTNSDKKFIIDKINQRISPEKLLYVLSILKYIAFLYILTLKANDNKLLLLSNLAEKFPIFNYAFSYMEYNQRYAFMELYDISISLENNQRNFDIDIMHPVFIRIAKYFYIDKSLYENFTFFNNKVNIVDIVNPPEPVSLDVFDGVSEINYNINNSNSNSNNSKEIYSPINKKEIINKKTYTERDANYNIDDDLFLSEGGKRKTKKNKRNKRKSNKKN